MPCKTVFLFCLIWLGLTNADSILPTIVWDPWNPLFACDEPRINIQIGDTINFLCSSDDLNFYVPSSHVSMVYENLYFLDDDKQKYKECNATGAKRLLYCNGAGTKLFTINFRTIQTTKDSLKFTKGETYYFIGTGFREKSKLDQTINGSCRYTDSNGKYRLRLQIYICKDTDINCKPCQSDGCYFKNCKRNTTKFCTNWISNSKIYMDDSSKNCSILQTRNCKDTLIGSNYDETRYHEMKCVSTGAVTDVKKCSSNDGLIIGIVAAFIMGAIGGAIVFKCLSKDKSTPADKDKENDPDINRGCNIVNPAYEVENTFET